MTKMMKKSRLQRLKKELEDLIIRDFEAFWDRFREITVGSVRQETLAHRADLSNLMSQDRLGTISYDDYSLNIRRLNNAAITLVSKLREEDLTEDWELLAAIHDSILVYCFDENDRKILEEVYDEYIFKSVHYAYADELQRIPSPKEDGTDWRIVVFSMAHIKDDIRNERELRDLDIVNRYNQECFKLLERIVEETDYYIVYHGNEFYRLKDWRNQVHAAKSPFSLLARTEEMLDYLKKTGR